MAFSKLLLQLKRDKTSEHQMPHCKSFASSIRLGLLGAKKGVRGPVSSGVEKGSLKQR
jgi:hypothetical protein